MNGLDSFFEYINFEIEEGVINAQISVNKSHPIYEGHFPDMPVTPGVVQLAIVKSVLIKGLEKDIQLIKSRDIKFLSMHIPAEKDLNVKINYKISENDDYIVKAEIVEEERVILKFNGTYKAK